VIDTRTAVEEKLKTKTVASCH